MNDSPKGRSFKYVIAKDKLHGNIHLILEKIFSIRNRRYKHSTTPLFISINPPQCRSENDKSLVTSFFKSISEFKEKYFVRFVTDTYWIEEIGDASLFYSFDGNVRDICDVSITLDILDNGYLSATTKFYKPNDHHLYLYNKGKDLKSILRTVGTLEDKDDYAYFVEAVYQKLFDTTDIREIDNNVTLLIIEYVLPTAETSHIAIPIVGMNHLDGQRWYMQSYREFVENNLHYTKWFLEKDLPNPDMIMEYLLTSIIECENLPDKIKRRSQIYALGELLFSYATMNAEDMDNLTRHDMIVFKRPTLDEEISRVVVVSMDDIAMDILK